MQILLKNNKRQFSQVMKNSNTLALFILVSLIVAGTSFAISQNATYEDGGNAWSQWISAQPEIGTSPSQYFVCGLAFRDMKWVQVLWNCNCGQRWYRARKRYRCNYCPNYFWSKTNAVKITYCSYADWNNQIQKIFESGNTESGGWRQFKCPKGQYASRATARFGWQHSTNIGLNGAQFKCENINFSENSFVQDNHGHPLRQLSKNTQGNYLSAIQIKFERGGKLTGIRYGFEAMPVISKISVNYAKIQTLNPKTTVIDNSEILNYGQTAGQFSITFNKTYTIRNVWSNNQQYTNAYLLSAGVTMNPLPWVENKIEFSTYQEKRETFSFAKSLATTYTSTQNLVVLAPPKKKIIVSSMIQEQNVNLPYEAILTLADRFSGKFIGEIKVTGVWEGVMASSVRTVITEEPVPEGEEKANLRTNNFPQSQK